MAYKRKTKDCYAIEGNCGYGWEIVADNDGMYPDKMGCAACFEFGIKKE